MDTKIAHMVQAAQKVFLQVQDALAKLDSVQYTQPSKTLFNATIGQHVRHIIELFIELEKGYEQGVVNYEKRSRDLQIETDKNFAASLLLKIPGTINKPDKLLILEAGYKDDSEETISIDTSYYREIAYNIEHSIHHMALIRVGINELCSIAVDENFGMASSTIKYRRACAQ